MTTPPVPQANDRIAFSGTDVSIPPLGVGTWAWGDKGTWGMGGYDSTYSEDTIHEAWLACLEAGVVLFDTAEVYGGGESERIIGRLLAKIRACARGWSSPPSSCRARGSCRSPAH